MRSVKIAEAKAQLSKHLRYVRAGGRVRIYDRDDPVADLVPIVEATDPDGGWTADDVADLERRGVLVPAKKPGGAKLAPMRGRMDPRNRASDGLIEDRRKGR
jgi:antitoxin (DNA-binding transcriptional repressor) of toxin-antitoxin stability system